MRAPFSAFIAVVAVTVAHPSDFDRQSWIDDFESAKAAIAQHSPNLDWALQRGMDLPAIEASARARLLAADDSAAARRALDRFVGAFADGHMEISWPSPADDGEAPMQPGICAALGYRAPNDESGVATRLPGYRALSAEGATIEAGVAPVRRARIGVLRIAQFSPSAAICERVVAELALPQEKPCDNACANSVYLRADNLFLREIAGAIRALKAARPRAILVDIAGNGGGSDTAIAAAHMLAGASLERPRMGVARSAARAQSLTKTAESLEAHANSKEARAYLAPLIAALRRSADEAGKACDMGPVWRGGAPPCASAVAGPFFAGGLVAKELPPHWHAAPWAETVSYTSRFEYEPGLWQGPLLVLVDNGSASAAELFAAMLQDSGGAKVIGAPTYGAGCGWNLPRQDIVLKNSGGRLSIPDCARFRSEGRNELDGVEPDFLVGFRPHDTPAQRVQRLNARLAPALANTRR